MAVNGVYENEVQLCTWIEGVKSDHKFRNEKSDRYPQFMREPLPT